MRVAALLLIAIVIAPAALQAEQYASGDHIVHTRRVPVIAHKAVPPFKGVHVYQGRSGRR